MSSTINEDGLAVTLAGERVREFGGRQDHGTKGTRRYYDECWPELHLGLAKRLAAAGYDPESEPAPFEGGVTDVSAEDRGLWLEHKANELLAADEAAELLAVVESAEAKEPPETFEEWLHGKIGDLPFMPNWDYALETFGSGGFHIV